MLKRLRLLFCLAAASFITLPAFGAGVLVTKTVQDGTGSHPQYFVDMSGTGAGPLQPAITCLDASANIGCGGGGSVTVAGFAPGGSYSTLSATTSTANVALPAGAVVVVYNQGSVPAFVKLGTSNAVTATTSNDMVPAGGGIALTVGSNTYLAAITGSSTTPLNLSGGSGIMTGFGGGAGGGGASGNVAQGSTTAGETGVMTQGAVTTAAPSYTTAQTSPVSLTTAGGLRVDGSGVTQPVSGTVTANVGTGTQAVSAASLPLPTGAATAANQPTPAAQGSTTSGQTGPLAQGAVTTSSPSYTTAQTSPISLTTAGAVRTDASAVTQPVSAASLPLPAGAAADASLTTINTTLGTPMQASGGALTANAGANLNTSALALESGGNLASILAAATGPIPAGTADIGNTGLAQASTTSGQKGPLAQGAVTTAAPSYTTAQTSPLSLTPAGALRVDQSGALPAQASTTAGQTGILAQAAAINAGSTPIVLTAGQTNPLSMDTAGNLRVGRGTFRIPPFSAMTVTASAYTTGNVLGGVQQFNKQGDAGKITGINVVSKATVAFGLKAYVFNNNPSSSTFTDKTAPALAAADILKLSAGPIVMTQDSGLGTPTLWSVTNLNIELTGVNNFYIVLIVSGAITPATTSDFNMTVMGDY